jgi:hypothetical protein
VADRAELVGESDDSRCQPLRVMEQYDLCHAQTPCWWVANDPEL